MAQACAAAEANAAQVLPLPVERPVHVEPAASSAEEEDSSDDEEPPAPPSPMLYLGYDTDADSQGSPDSSYSSCSPAEGEAGAAEGAEEVDLYNPWAQAA